MQTSRARNSDGTGAGAAPLLVVSLVALNLALHGHQLGARGLALVLVAGSVGGAVVVLTGRTMTAPAPLGLRGLVAIGLVLQLALLALTTADGTAMTPMVRVAAASGWLLVAAGAAGLVVADGRAARRALSMLLVGLTVCGLAWLTGSVTIDVLTFQEVAAARLAEGQNPYVGPYPNPYGAEEVLEFWAPEMVGAEGELLTGFPYMPASLVLSSIATWLFGDPRVAHLAAVVVTVGLLARRGDPMSRYAAALFGSSPLLLFVVQQAWTETFVALAVVAALLARPSPRLQAPVIGGLAAMKQYAGLLAVVHLWFLHRSRGGDPLRRVLGRAAVVFAGLTLPFVLWDPGAFLDSVVGLHLSQRYRPDSLSLLAATDGMTGGSLVGWSMGLTAASVTLTVAFLLRAGTRHASTPALAVALVMASLLIFARQAHVNYWLVVGAALAAAVATSGANGTAPSDVGPTAAQRGR